MAPPKGGGAKEKGEGRRAGENPSVRVLSGDPRPPAQAPPTHRVTRPGHFSPERGPTSPSPETAGKWYIPEVTSRSPSAASDTYRKWRTEAGASRDCGGRGDPGAAATMGRAFGNLTRVRHVITYSLSPFEQRAFPHYFTKGIPNVLRRIQASILRSAPRECPGRVGAGLPSPALTAGPSSSACCRAGALRLAIHTFSH